MRYWLYSDQIMITFKTPRSDQVQALYRAVAGMYLFGNCYPFAAALHRDLGWPLFGLRSVNPTGVRISHAFVQKPDGPFWDVRGPVDKALVGELYDISPDNIGPVTLEELQKSGPFRKDAVDRASRIAQALWPDLPWHADIFRSRTRSFLGELETLCRKHHLWMRAAIPAQKIHLYEMDGDEIGFTASLADNGEYVFDRQL